MLPGATSCKKCGQQVDEAGDGIQPVSARARGPMPTFIFPTNEAISVPAICVACGAPAPQSDPLREPARLTVREATTGVAFNISFPLCPDCGAAQGRRPGCVLFGMGTRLSEDDRRRLRLMDHAIKHKLDRGGGLFSAFKLHVTFADATFSEAFASLNLRGGRSAVTLK